MLTTSPVAIPAPSPERAESATSASPVSTAARTASSVPPASFSSSIASRICERGADRPLGVVLVDHRRAEDRHDRVADELLDRAAEALDLVLDARVVRAERRADVLRIGPIGARREPDEIDEEDGDDLALLLRGRGAERRRAGAAEAEAVGILLAAPWADEHAPRLRR